MSAFLEILNLKWQFITPQPGYSAENFDERRCKIVKYQAAPEKAEPELNHLASSTCGNLPF